MEAGEGSLKRVVIGRGEDVEVAAWVWGRRTSAVLVDEDRLWIVDIMASLVAVGRSKHLEARRASIWVVVDAQGHLDVQVHPVSQWRRNTNMGVPRHAVADDQLVGTQPRIA